MDFTANVRSRIIYNLIGYMDFILWNEQILICS